MNIRETISIQSPNGIEEKCAKFTIDDIAMPFVFESVTDIDEEYVFSAWMMSDGNSSITVENNELSLSTEWQKQKVVFNASDNSLKIYFNNIGIYYFYHSQLESGNIETDWSPSPKDLEAELELKVNSEDLISEINASANVIRLKSNRLVVESDNLQIYEDGTLKTQRGEIGGFILHDKILTGVADRYAEINIKYKTYSDVEEHTGYIKIGNESSNEGNGGSGIFVKDYDIYGYGIFTRIGNVLGGGILIETEEPNDALHIDPNGISRVDGKAVCINGREYGVNKVLATPGWYMNASQTVTLSEAISAQTNGIVLVWSAYSDNKVQDFNFAFTFIPKRFVALKPGCGVDTPLLRADMSTACGCKYLYINDTTIKGHDNNRNSGTGKNGITYNNDKYVLRYVIGV